MEGWLANDQLGQVRTTFLKMDYEMFLESTYTSKCYELYNQCVLFILQQIDQLCRVCAMIMVKTHYTWAIVLWASAFISENCAFFSEMFIWRPSSVRLPRWALRRDHKLSCHVLHPKCHIFTLKVFLFSTGFTTSKYFVFQLKLYNPRVNLQTYESLLLKINVQFKRVLHPYVNVLGEHFIPL